MNHWRVSRLNQPCRLAAALLLCLGPIVQAQVPPEKAVATFTVHNPELALSLWAAEPLFANPTCIDIDHKGRVWVCESVNYRHTLHHQPPHRPAGDRILILEDSKGTGKADKVTTFYQSPNVLAPLGIAVAKDPVGPGYKVFVCQSPDILVFEDKDGDGKADGPPKKLLHGFNGFDHDHGVHGILIGPDGKLYFSVGDQGVSGLRGKNSKKVWNSNHTDCQGGTIWRCDLDGSNLQLIAHNFRNEYEPCLDSFGTIFVSDNDDDGSEQTRICYVMPGGNYGYWPRGPGQSHWHEEQPGVVPKILRTYFGSPTGMQFYEGTLLPKKYWGQLLHTDAGPRQVRCYHLTPKGAGYDVDREDLVTSTDTWFRPSDICVAPDGSVYVADWYDPGVGGHGIGDFTRGRIYRIAPKGNRPSVPKVDLESKKGLLAALASPNRAVRYMAMAKIKSMARDHARKVLITALSRKDNVPLRARALWLLAANKRTLVPKPGSPEVPEHDDTVFFDLALDKKTDVRLRVQAIRILRDYFGAYPGRNYNHPDLWNAPPAVRRELLLASRYYGISPPGEETEAIFKLARKYDSHDRFYLEAIGIAVGHYDKARRDVILKDFAKEFPEWNDKVADLVWELQPPDMLPILEKRLADPKLPLQQRNRIVEILSVYPDASAGKSLLRALQSPIAPETRDHIISNLKLALAGKWQDLGRSPELATAIDKLLGQSQTRVTGLALIGIARKADVVGKVAAVANDTKEGTDVRSAAVETLGTLGTKDALKALQGLALGNDTLPVRQEAVIALAGTRSGALWLLQAQKKKELPKSLRADGGSLLRNSPYDDIRRQAKAVFPAPGRLDVAKLPSIATLARRRGRASRGKQIISSNKDIRCLSCHTIRGTGGHVGPDLSMIGKKASRENLFESILYPSKAIADQYLNWIIATKDGLSLTGLIVEETADHIILRDANGKDTNLAKARIEARTKSPNSLMPNDLLAYMTEDDLVDIVEYLLTLKTASLVMDYWNIAGPFDNGVNDAGLDRVFPPEKGIDFKATYQGKAGKVSWRRVKPNDSGYVDLQAFLGKDSDNVVSYLYREIESPADQDGKVLLGTDDCAKLWINGKLVYTNRKHQVAVSEADSVPIKLKKGRNTILLKINNGGGPHGFYLTLQTEQEMIGNK